MTKKDDERGSYMRHGASWEPAPYTLSSPQDKQSLSSKGSYSLHRKNGLQARVRNITVYVDRAIASHVHREWQAPKAWIHHPKIPSHI
jgi:hypothetical protein